MKSALAMLMLVGVLTGCGTPTVRGRVVVRLTDNGVVANCESDVVNGFTGESYPPLCSAVEVKDERTKAITQTSVNSSNSNIVGGSK